MLPQQELEKLLTDLESDRVERKENLNDTDKIRQAICAFANDMPDHKSPGVLFVGVKNDGSCAKSPITDELLLKLASMRDDGQILPLPMMSVNKSILQGCEVAIVQVEPAYNPPVRYNGRAWIRVGPRRATATREEELRLAEKRRASDIPFDQQPVKDANVNEDLDLTFFQRSYFPSAVAPEVLAENQRSVEQQLASLRFLSKENVPNNAALLIAGKDPRNWLPGAYVQFVRFDGASLTDAIRSEKEISGSIPDLLRQVDEVLEANISVANDIISGPTQIRRADYPIAALRQLLYNAVLHRSYEFTNSPVRIYWFTDRIEIHSPGGPYGIVDSSNFGQAGVTDYRNPLLAEAMKVLGFVQRFGVGIATAREQAKKNGNPEVKFDVQPVTVLATVWR